MNRPLPCWLVWLALLLTTPSTLAESRCFGTTSNGSIKDAVRLPTRGDNFSAYSLIGVSAGRTYVHSTVAAIVVAAYARLADEWPATHYVYGETGWPTGGRMRPHRTHQNGLSVDFFVPVLNEEQKSVPLPTALTSRMGYDIEFDAAGRQGEYQIDFAALAEHLYQLHRAAQARHSGIARVILDPTYLPKLFATPRGDYLRRHLIFMKTQAWVRHDEHYHVDFAIPCKASLRRSAQATVAR